MPTAAERIADFTRTLTLAAIPAEVRLAARLHLLDTLGCGLAAHALGIATEGRALLDEIGAPGAATAIGHPRRVHPAGAAFANAMLGHGLDFDDTHGDSICHVSVVVGLTALAVAEARRATGAALLAAVVAGNEVVTRLGMAASGTFHARGFHPTAVCGIFGAAAAAARLQGLDGPTTTSALGIAGSMASGLLAFLEDGSATKPIHAGWAAHGAVIATQLAARGAAGPRSVLEARFGLFHAFAGHDGIDLGPAVEDLGTRWETRRIAYKAYPACHMMHGALAALAEAAGDRTLAPEEIAEVVVRVPKSVVPIILEPAATKAAPRTTYEAKFSLPYSAAAMLLRGAVELATYSPAALGDPDLGAVARRVRYETHEYPTAARAFPGGARLHLRDGRVLEAECPYQKGAPENPLTPEEVRRKFRGNAALALSAPAIEALETGVLGLEEAADLSAVCAPLGALWPGVSPDSRSS
jgi:2-methylcitrate dehydratase PrpD